LTDTSNGKQQQLAGPGEQLFAMPSGKRLRCCPRTCTAHNSISNRSTAGSRNSASKQCLAVIAEHFVMYAECHQRLIPLVHCLHASCAADGLQEDSNWQQVFVQDDGVALLAAVQQQGELQLWLWRQLGGGVDQQNKAWQQLPAVPVQAGKAASSAQQGSIQAAFVRQGLSGLQLQVAHATSAAGEAMIYRWL
jgi:hypothetical protein